LRACSVAAVVSAIVLVASCAHGEALVRVDSRGDQGLTAAFVIPAAEEVRDASGGWLGLKVPGFVPLLPGSLGVDVPVRAYLVGIPPDVQISCEIVDATYDEIDENDVLGFKDRLGGMLDDIPGRPAEIVVTGFLRDQRVAGLRVAPVVYNRETGRIRVFRTFTAEIGFQGLRGRGSGSQTTGRGADPAAEAFYERALLNYGQARSWRRTPLLGSADGDYFSDSSNWLKIRIDTTGIYCITGKDLEQAGVSPGTIATSGLRLYTGGGLPLVESLAERNPDWMRMPAIKVLDGGDGKIDRADSIIFYGLGMYDWADFYDPAFDIESHYGSFFSDHNYYWLTWGGTFTEPVKRMETVDVSGCSSCPSCYEPEAFFERVHMEEDWRYAFSIRGDDGWYWRLLSLNNTASFTVPTPHPDQTRGAVVKMRLGDEHPQDECTFEDGIPYYYRAVLRLNGAAIKDTTWRAGNTALNVIDLYGKGDLVSSESQSVQIYLPTDLPPDPQYEGAPVCSYKPDLAWYEVYYWRRFVADGARLFFLSPDTTCTARFGISGFASAGLRAFDLTDQFDVKLLTGFDVSSGPDFTVTLCDTLTKGALKRYAVISRQALMHPAEISRVNIAGIRFAQGKPYCVITHKDLADAGQEISQYHDGEMVTVQQIYDEFGWGVPDVTAIRDFLRWRYEHGELDDVLLLGDATWDYKGYLAGETFFNYVPSYERRYRVGANNPYNTDDWFVYLVPADDQFPGSDSIAYFPTVPISRLPATSPEVAEFLVEQSMDYVSDPEIGLWQNRVIFVADDDRVGTLCDPISQGRHVTDAEEMSDDAFPQVFDHVKIYLTEYEKEPTGLKPDAKRDLIKNLNEGALMTNFVGHGDPRRWTQEEVFNLAAVDLVNAGRRQTLLVASSCNVSKFDEPTFASVAEELLLRPEGATIASFASTHYCQAEPNRWLHESFARLLFEGGKPYPTIPIGEAAIGGKAAAVAVNRSWRFNNEMYSLLGDPGLELAVPRLEVRFDTPASDTLKRRGVYSFRARVFDGDTPADAFQGKSRIFARESDDTTGYDSDICYVQPGNVPKHFDYDLPGSVIFRGKSAVADGGLDFGLFVASGAREGDRGNIRCFVTDGMVSGAGLLDSLVISGQSTADDVIGPQLTLETEGAPLASGDTVLVGQTIEMILFDESGVAVKGKSDFIPSVSLVFDDGERVGFGDSLFAVDGDFTESRVSFEVPQLSAGQHTLSVTAFDNVNNSTTEEYELTVGQRGTGAGNVVYAYPNPAGGRCYIVWEYQNDRYVEVVATIYTLAGRKIWTGSAEGRSSQHLIEWDGTDFSGDQVANGTYLAVVEASAPSAPDFKTKDTVVIALIR
jgi:hypothetical protein